MKKPTLIIIIICGIIVALIIGLGNNYNLKNNNKNDGQNTSKDKNNSNKENANANENNKKQDEEINIIPNENYPLFKEINFEEYIKLFNKGDLVILYTGRPSCPACASFVPILEQFRENYPNIDIYYIQSDKVDMASPSYEEFKGLDEKLNSGYTYIPWLIIAKDKKVLKDNVGTLDYNSLILLFEEYNVI